MGAKALGMVLAVFQVFAGGTKLFFFFFVSFYFFFSSSSSCSYSSSSSSGDKATTNGKLGSLSCSPTLLRNVGICCYSRVVAEIVIKFARFHGWICTETRSLRSRGSECDANVLLVAGHPVGVAWDRTRRSPRFRAMLLTTNHLGTPRRLGNCRYSYSPLQ